MRALRASPQDGPTALLQAARGGYAEVVGLLLRRGADVGSTGAVGAPRRAGERAGHWRVAGALSLRGL